MYIQECISYCPRPGARGGGHNTMMDATMDAPGPARLFILSMLLIHTIFIHHRASKVQGNPRYAFHCLSRAIMMQKIARHRSSTVSSSASTSTKRVKDQNTSSPCPSKHPKKKTAPSSRSPSFMKSTLFTQRDSGRRQKSPSISPPQRYRLGRFSTNR